jgi:5-aminopentanamidase
VRCAALQIAHRFGDPEAALAQADQLLAEAGPLDLALLPEACLTGYVSPSGDFDLRPQAEPLDGPTCARLAALARRHRVALAGPLIEQDGDHFHNAFVIHDAQGQRVAHYRKRHPWFPETWATPGKTPYPRLSIGGSTVALAICFDFHFLTREAAPLLDASDVLLFPSAWVNGDSRVDTRAHLVPRLAARHRVAVVNANWARSRPALSGQGGSMIVGPAGETLASGGQGPCAVVATV